MKLKRGLLLASGIIFIVIAALYAIIAIVSVPMFDTIILPLLEAELEELVMIGEEELANELRNYMDFMQNGAVVLLAVMAIVDLVLGILLIKHSKASDKILLEKRVLVITSIIVAFFTAGSIISILLIVAMSVKVETIETQTDSNVVNNTATSTTIDNMDQTQINEKYESKIRRLQDLRDKGAITKEEYQKLLKQIFEE